MENLMTTPPPSGSRLSRWVQAPKKSGYSLFLNPYHNKQCLMCNVQPLFIFGINPSQPPSFQVQLLTMCYQGDSVEIPLTADSAESNPINNDILKKEVSLILL